MIHNDLTPRAETDDDQPPAAPGGQGSGGAEKDKKRPRSWTRLLVELGVGIVLALVLALGVRAFAFQVFFVPSGSMEPTLQVGDRILVDKFLFDAHSLHPGTIIVFRTPPLAMARCATTDGDLVKRVVAVGGETIYSHGNTIYVDSKPQSESYLPASEKDDLGEAIPLTTVPHNDVFVLGDNRAISCDSRVWGPVPDKNIVGTVVAIVWRSWHPDLHIF